MSPLIRIYRRTRNDREPLNLKPTHQLPTYLDPPLVFGFPQYRPMM